MPAKPRKQTVRAPAHRSYTLVDPRLATNPRNLARFLHDEVKLTDREIGTATSSDPGTVSRWRSHKTVPAAGTVRPLDDMRVIVELLANSGVLTLEEAGGFLRARVVPPDDEVPLEVLADGTDGFKRVRRAAEAFVDAILVRSTEIPDEEAADADDELVLLGGQADHHRKS